MKRSGSRTSARCAGGLARVAAEIEASAFDNAYRGSSLETVVGAVAEQRQSSVARTMPGRGKPKLRIPDIYEHPENHRVFDRLLDTCACSTEEAQVLAAVQRLAGHGIKGLRGRRQRTCPTSSTPRSCRRSTRPS